MNRAGGCHWTGISRFPCVFGKSGANELATAGEWVRERAVAGRHRTGVESGLAEERQ